MRQTEREKWWTSLAYVGGDGLALYCWLRWVAADMCGIVHCNPDTAQIACQWPHRSRATKALRALSAPENGAPLVVWSPEAGIVYIRNWPQLDASLAPRQASHIKTRLADLAALPDCEARRVAELELEPFREELDIESQPELQIVRTFRLKLPRAPLPSRADRAPKSELRTIIEQRWQAHGNEQFWSTYFNSVASRTRDGSLHLRLKGFPDLPVTLPALLDHKVMVALRATKPLEVPNGSAQAA